MRGFEKWGHKKLTVLKLGFSRDWNSPVGSEIASALQRCSVYCLKRGAVKKQNIIVNKKTAQK